eukprot:1354238-Rhodomonas_salina.2
MQKPAHPTSESRIRIPKHQNPHHQNPHQDPQNTRQDMDIDNARLHPTARTRRCNDGTREPPHDQNPQNSRLDIDIDRAIREKADRQQTRAPSAIARIFGGKKKKKEKKDSKQARAANRSQNRTKKPEKRKKKEERNNAPQAVDVAAAGSLAHGGRADLLGHGGAVGLEDVDGEHLAVQHR